MLDNSKLGATSPFSSAANSTLNNSILDKVLKKTNLLKPDAISSPDQITNEQLW